MWSVEYEYRSSCHISTIISYVYFYDMMSIMIVELQGWRSSQNKKKNTLLCCEQIISSDIVLQLPELDTCNGDKQVGFTPMYLSVLSKHR